ncbi:hypothetical protein L4D04_23510 [Photobacterium angustum]|uniref:hypothetical protein n=1 Tax=Photobacterium angustum TaxID=661 RepID=UPI003D146984
MKNIQCTFRLPQQVIELIDKQKGKTRTDKLLNLLGHGCNQDDYSVIEKRLELVERRLAMLESLSDGKLKEKVSNQANEKRSLEVKERLFSALNTLKEKDEIPLYRGKPSISKLKEITGIDRGTISKYLEEWLELTL